MHIQADVIAQLIINSLQHQMSFYAKINTQGINYCLQKYSMSSFIKISRGVVISTWPHFELSYVTLDIFGE